MRTDNNGNAETRDRWVVGESDVATPGEAAAAGEPVTPGIEGGVDSEGSEGTGRPFDADRAAAAVRELLIAVGEDPDRQGLRETPARVARAYGEMFAGLFSEPDAVLNTVFDEGHQEMILVRDIAVYSTCEHHLVPFHGVAHVGYIPGINGKVTGLSKLARVVDLYAKRPQVQERLTSQIADALVRKLDPRAAIVVIEAEHLCMAMRGIRKPGATTTTSAVRGLFKTSAVSRGEALDLILRK